MEVVKMKKKKSTHSTRRVALAAMICLILGSIGGLTAFASTSDIPDKGWDKLVGTSMDEMFLSTISTSNGGTFSVGSQYDKTEGLTYGIASYADAGGSEIWRRVTKGVYEELRACVQLRDGSLIAAGVEDNTGLLIKYDKSGQLIWKRTISGDGAVGFNSLLATPDGGFAAIGKSYAQSGADIVDNNNGASDGYIAKYDSDGILEWDNQFGSPSDESFNDIAASNDGGFIVSGVAISPAGATNTGGEITDAMPYSPTVRDGLLVKFDYTGKMVWNNLYGGTASDDFLGVTSLPDGSCVVVGYTFRTDGDYAEPGQTTHVEGLSGIAVKFNQYGTPQWRCILDKTATGYPLLRDVATTHDGGFIAAGVTYPSTSYVNGDGMLTKINNLGFQTNTVYVGGSSGDELTAVSLNGKGTIRAVGYASAPYGGTIQSAGFGGKDALLVEYGTSLCDVDYIENGGSNVQDLTVGYDESLTEPVTPTKLGHTFLGWFRDSDFATQWNFETDQVTVNTTLYAKWTPSTYQVSFDSRGGSTVSSMTALYETSISDPVAPKRTGYAFAGWYKESACINQWSFPVDKITSDTTLYAKWKPATYYVTFRGNGATTGTMTYQTMTYDAPKALYSERFKKTGYSFLGWATTSTGPVVYKNGATVKNLTSVNGKNVTLYAKWGAPIKSAVSAGYNKVKVSWSYAGSATSYRIYRATSAAGKYTLVYKAKSTARSWTNTGLITGKTYYYKVYPVAAGKVYKHSKYLYAKPIPATPTVKLAKVTTKSIRISWTGVSGATKYQVYRAVGSTGKYTLVYTGSSKTRYWTNTGLTKGKTYYYKVRAYHLEGKTKVYGKLSTIKYLKL
jgi:uncharacterized repeat protein (TIGR02543 family)